MDRFVWIFNGNKSKFPSGVFAARADAESWIRRRKLTGVLTKYPVDVGAYDWAVEQGLFAPKKVEQTSAEFIANFSSAAQEHIHF